MTPAFKHRLLGTVILVLAGIIFLPDLLDGEKQVVKDDFKVIPNRPEFKGVPQQQAFDQQAFEQARTEVTPEPVDELALDTEEQTPKDDNGLPSQRYTQVTAPSADRPATTRPVNEALAQAGWVVRVGSFSKPQNANALVAKLRQAGFVTFTRDISNAQGVKLTSVLVGPELRKERLEQQLPKLQQLTGIERLSVMSYQPTENN
ncbi:SPOR domain-containing protein [Rheinheimera sp. EpRS3]|uniref:SPOR domain-containing protein n=1 Tax=Rheinheimera sp. EpRS3 TaxID=1712383 RepID=UPI0007499B03|nr:SPOR domain-containing protein [Rheinheimera sp. EpRS3]KUM54790.1 dedD protein [Rheinheimera sp. EpRS3]